MAKFRAGRDSWAAQPASDSLLGGHAAVAVSRVIAVSNSRGVMRPMPRWPWHLRCDVLVPLTIATMRFARDFQDGQAGTSFRSILNRVKDCIPGLSPANQRRQICPVMQW